MPEPKTPEENDRSDSNDDVSLTEAQLAELKWRIAAYKGQSRRLDSLGAN